VLGAMTTEEKSALLEGALRYHRLLGFPYPAVPSDKRLASEIVRLREYQPSGSTFLAENAGLGVCSAYMPHRFEARNSDADFSALGAFQDDTRLQRALQFSLRQEHPGITRRGLRSSLTALNRTPTNFRPAVAKALVERYSSEGGVVLDPCAGWGGRMLGTLVMGRRYVGIEPNKRTADCLFRLGTRFCEHLRLDRSFVRIVEEQIQSVPLGSVQASFAMTSPPYWGKEVYDPNEVGTSLDEWITTFLHPLFRVVSGLLADGAAFAVNIVDITVDGQIVPLESLTLKAAESHGFFLETTWLMSKASFGDQTKGRSEPIFVFRKNACVPSGTGA
jgi:hypothetical protein